MNTACQTAATSCFIPLETNPVYLPTSIALSWGAFLLDGLLESHIAPYTAVQRSCHIGQSRLTN